MTGATGRPALRCSVDVEALAVEFEVGAAQNATIKTHMARLVQRIAALHAQRQCPASVSRLLKDHET